MPRVFKKKKMLNKKEKEQGNRHSIMASHAA